MLQHRSTKDHNILFATFSMQCILLEETQETIIAINVSCVKYFIPLHP